MSVLRNLLGFSGRMNRREYAAVFFGTMLTLLLALAPIIILSKAIGDKDADGYLGIFALVVIALCKWINLAALAKRLHDVGTSGWACLLALVPLVGLVLYLAMFFVPGTKSDNGYGPPRSFFRPRTPPAGSASSFA
jgi:uncharacterized membrane protein YhaH (DUF805 family)